MTVRGRGRRVARLCVAFAKPAISSVKALASESDRIGGAGSMDSNGRMPWMRIVTPQEAASPESKARKARDAFRGRILDTLDMIAVMRDYMRLRRRGRDYCGSCPLHHDRGESLWVRPDRGTFKCFDCGLGGTLFDFMRHLKRIDESTATAYLADLAGIADGR